MARSDTQSHAVFLLSPAHCGAKRAQLLINERAGFPLAVRLRHQGAPLGAVFSFLSGLYFRGKLTYAQHFAHDAPHGGVSSHAGRGDIPRTQHQLYDACDRGVAFRPMNELRDPLERGDANALAQ